MISKQEALNKVCENISNTNTIVNSDAVEMYSFGPKTLRFYKITVIYCDEFSNFFKAIFHILPHNSMVSHWEIKQIKDEADILSAL